MCDSCRDRYLKLRKSKIDRKIMGGVPRRKNEVNAPESPINSPTEPEMHVVMRNNAMFLLDLASASGFNIPKQQRRPSQTLSSVAENYSPPESFSPASPFLPTGPFQCLQALGANSNYAHDQRVLEETLKRQNGHKWERNLANGRVISSLLILLLF